MHEIRVKDEDGVTMANIDLMDGEVGCGERGEEENDDQEDYWELDGIKTIY